MNILALKKPAKSNWKYICILCTVFLLLAILANFPLINTQKFPITTDFIFHYQRLLGMVKSLSAGHWPTINTQFLNGLGYPVDLFYSNFFLLPLAFVGTHGVSLIFTLKLFFIAVTFATFLSMYWATNVVSESPAVSFVAAILYGFSFFRLRDLYYRVGIGSITIFIFIPLIIAGYYQIFYKQDKKGWFALAVGMSGLILSHVITTFLVLLALIICTLISHSSWTKVAFKQVFKAAAFTFGLTSFFTLPLIEQMTSYTYFAEIHPVKLLENSTVTIIDFLAENFTIYPFSSYLISVPILIALLLRVFLIKSPKTTLMAKSDISLIIGLIFVVLMFSFIPWKQIRLLFPLINSIQYVNRFIPLALPFLSFSAAAISVSLVYKMSTKLAQSALLLVTLLVVLTSIPYLNAVKALSFGTVPVSPDSFRIGGGKEYLPAETNLNQLRKLAVSTVINQHAATLHVTSFVRNDTTLTVTGTSTTSQQVVLPLLYYKGYTAVINGKDVPLRTSKQHLIAVSLAPGAFTLAIHYSGTLIQHLSVWLSLLSLISLAIYLFFNWQQQFSKNKKSSIN